MAQQITSRRRHECAPAQWDKAIRLQDRNSGYDVGSTNKIASTAHITRSALVTGLAVGARYRCLTGVEHCGGHFRRAGRMHERSRCECSENDNHEQAESWLHG